MIKNSKSFIFEQTYMERQGRKNTCQENVGRKLNCKKKNLTLVSESQGNASFLSHSLLLLPVFCFTVSTGETKSTGFMSLFRHHSFEGCRHTLVENVKKYE